MISFNAPSTSYLRAILDAIPVPVFVVDVDVTILMGNVAARQFANRNTDDTWQIRSGDLLSCVQAVSEKGGCGHSAACADCIIRNAVHESLNGQQVVRRKAKMRLINDSGPYSSYMLVTASPLDSEEGKRALLILEDINELIALQRIVPICSHCKKVRTDDDFWEQVDSYLRRHLDVDFSHGVCPDCLKLYYPEFIAQKKAASKI